MSKQATRILVVDDERFFREVIGEVLERAGLPFVAADTGAGALSAAQDPAIGVAILDVQLPDLNGIEVFRRLRELRPDLRVIILSAHTDQEYVLEALRLGACDYLAKPIHEEELALAVRRALETYELGADWHRLRERLRALEGALDRLWTGEGDGDGALPDAAARAAADVLAATKASLLLLDEQGQELRVAGLHGRAIAVDEMDPVPIGAGIAGQALSRAEPVVVEDITRDPRFSPHAAPGRYETGSFAMAPVAVGEERIGVLCVTDRAGGQPFDDDDLALLRILATQVGRRLRAPAPGAASAQAPARDAAGEDAGEDAELARAVCEAVAGEVEPGRLLAAALRPLAAALGAAPVSIYLATPEGLVREAEWDGGVRGDRDRLPAARGLTGGVAQSGQLVASGDPAADPRFDPAVDTPADGRPGPLLCGALRFRGKVLGVFRAFPEAAGAPSPRTGEVLSAALSAAVRNVLLYRSLVESIDEVARARREGLEP
ncbi:MAG TPA: response regulator [Myxococcota bacterium]|jgi:DNA-binding response OmpR family regulator|nr:response regulator [Myxococcota bacterium]